MRTSVPCPNCDYEITLDDFKDFSSPFTMKCPHCHAKLKETKVMPFLLIGLIIMVPIFILIAEALRTFLKDYIPFVENISTALIFIVLCYPIYVIYERMNGLIMFNKGNLKLKKRQ